MPVRRTLTLLFIVASAACGPADRSTPEHVDSTGAAACSAVETACNDALDDDCDGRADCSDTDCSGVGDCPICGAVDNPEVSPLALPDGIGSGATCSTDAQCTDAIAPNCVAKECHASYVSTLDFIGFTQGATLTDPTKLLKVCVTMEHSWLRDLQMELITPSGVVFILHKFVGRNGNEIFLGAANDNDPANAPVPGSGGQYCWTATASQTMLDAPTVMVANHATLPPGDYASIAPWSALTNSPLNGKWSMRVTDLWGSDNGFMFTWSIAFDPALVSDCAGPIIL